MLKITIRAHGSLTIGEDITIYNSHDFAVRLAIDAPRDIAILREDAKDKQPKPS